MGQTDIEHAVVASDPQKYPTCRLFADQSGWSVSSVRRAIRDGHLKAAGKPLRITGGAMPLTTVEWRRVIDESLQHVSRGVWGVSNGGDTIEILDRDLRTHIFKRAPTAYAAKNQAAEISRLNVSKRMTGDRDA